MPDMRLRRAHTLRGIYIDTKVVYRRYASLFFVCGISQGDNELVVLEVIHRYVEVLDRYFGNVSRSFFVDPVDIDCPCRCANLTCTRTSEDVLHVLSSLSSHLSQDLQLPEGVCRKYYVHVMLDPPSSYPDPRRTHHCRRAARVIKEICP